MDNRVRFPANMVSELNAAAEKLGLPASALLGMAFREWQAGTAKKMGVVDAAAKPAKPPKREKWQEEAAHHWHNVMTQAEREDNDRCRQEQWRPQWAERLHKHIEQFGDDDWADVTLELVRQFRLTLPDYAWEKAREEYGIDPDNPKWRSTEHEREMMASFWWDYVYEPWVEENIA
jgi:hypothetical protein